MRAEPRRLAERLYDLLDEAAESVEPDDRSLKDWFANYRREHRRRLAVDLHLITERVLSGSRVLEYGAVPLLLTAALANLDLEVSAVDLKPQRFASAIAVMGLDVKSCDVETEPVPFADDTFDLILFNELFEHLRINPVFTLREAYRVLKPGGSMLLSTPNLRSFRGLRNLLVHNQGHAVSAGVFRQYEKLDTVGHMGHVREYTTREVADFVGRIGFDVEEIIYRGGHGRGLVGIAERLAPSWRPFFTLVARKQGPQSHVD